MAIKVIVEVSGQVQGLCNRKTVLNKWLANITFYKIPFIHVNVTCESKIVSIML